MTEVIIVQPSFCPTRKMLDFNLESVRSLKKYLDKHPYPADIIFGGYIDDEYYDEFLNELKSLFSGRCKFFRFDKNYGKAYIVNKMVNDYLVNNNVTKYIFTFDSDIVFLDNNDGDIIERLKRLSNKTYLVQGRKFGLIGCNFTGDNAHWLNRFENNTIIDNETISWPTQPVGIAGGCIFINVDAWRSINGYRIMGVYAPDDAMMIRDMFNSGFGICVATSIFVHHPGTHDDRHYQGWKEKTSRTFMNLSDSIEYTNDYWKNKKILDEGKLKLSNITLAIVDCVDVNRAIKAIEYSCKEIEYGEIKLLTSLKTDYKHVVRCNHISSKQEYSKFCIKELNQYIDTDYVLLIQYDGFVIGGRKGWTDEFLKYDYIGSPWWYTDGFNVGNGGFSLRSKKLLNALQDTEITQYHPEDHHIGRTYRKYLESKGIVFPSEELAAKFSIEKSHKMGDKYNGQFGFHGFDILKVNNIKY